MRFLVCRGIGRMKESTKRHLLQGIGEEQVGITTTELAKKIGLSRSVTSLYLNELAKNKEVIKSETYPIVWRLTSHDYHTSQDVFEQFIGSKGSAKSMIKTCKAAMSYPPKGLPVLIHGNSGVGKTYLAHLIFDYLNQQQANCSDNIVVFNCADYANNPELLSSTLFGHKKGAYTGAAKDKKGLLSKADNGILFLDEVHRLSYENQEKLFQFMDSGQFRLIGEEDKVETANVRLIFATTEDPKEVLLPTFLRRISAVLELADYHLRPLQERETILRVLFLKEAKLLKKDMMIDRLIFDRFLHEKMSGNIGQLANKVKLYCADALHYQEDKDVLYIGDNHDDVVKVIFDEPLNQLVDVSKEMPEKLNVLLHSTSDVLELRETLLGFPLSKDDFGGETYVLKQIREKILANTKQIMGKVDSVTPYLEKLTTYLLLKDCIKFDHQPIKQMISMDYPRTALFAKKITSKLPVEYKKEARFLLSLFLIGSIKEEIAYHALLVAHGDTTASSIQAVSNQLCGNYVFDAINMPLDASIKDIVLEVKSWLSERDTSEGVIMLVDMGSLVHFYKSLKPEIMGELLVVNNLTTSFALEIGQQLLNHHTFYDITKNIKQKFITDIQYFEGFSNDRNVIISSILGYDIAKKLKKLFEPFINPEIKIIVMHFNELLDILDRENSDKGYLDTTELIITTSYLDNKTAVSSVNLLDILDEDTEHQAMKYTFRNTIHEKYMTDLTNKCIYFFSKEGLSEKLNFLNPEIIIKQVELIIEKCERRFGIKFNVKIKFNLTMHLALMIERTILGSVDYPVPTDLSLLKVNDNYFYSNIKDLLSSIEDFYRISISDWELYVLHEIIAS